MSTISTDPTPTAYKAQLEVQLAWAQKQFDKADDALGEAYYRHDKAVEALPTFEALKQAQETAKTAADLCQSLELKLRALNEVAA